MNTPPTPLGLGVDVGGTKISAVLLDRDGAAQAHLRVATPRDDYDATIAVIVGLVSQLESQAGLRLPVGIGIPGSLNPETGLVRNANSTWLNGRNFKADLAVSLDRPVRMANDADCFALSEATDGAGKAAHTVWGIILGTGCGSGLVIAGRLHKGPLAIAGEWGHNPLTAPPSDHQAEEVPPICWCGRHGCIETWLSGPAIAADHARITGSEKTTEEIFAAAHRTDPDAMATLDRHRRRLAGAMAAVINILDPDVIILGGGIGSQPSLLDGLQEAILPHIFSDAPSICLRRPRFGDDSGVRGAARLWWDSPDA